IPAKAGIKQFQYVLDAGSVIPDLIRDRHDGIRLFTRASTLSLSEAMRGMEDEQSDYSIDDLKESFS
ncbi:MAG: hypothetical protein COX19_10545, partial [Desulfobacterales bacterium CG23_combo_of_CG06-09_8_20_14_all_51_8]